MPTAQTCAPACMPDFRIQFKVFEGPMDLLLFLVKKQEVDICEVNLTGLATQFIEYVELMKQLDLDQAGEFIVSMESSRGEWCSLCLGSIGCLAFAGSLSWLRCQLDMGGSSVDGNQSTNRGGYFTGITFW